MKKGVFTTGDMDNIDQHKRSNLSKTAFHGTLITLTNHISHENLGVEREPLDISNVDTSPRPQLPDSYTIVPSAELNANADLILKKTDKPVRPGKDKISAAILKDEAWTTHASDLILSKNGNLNSGDIVTWAGKSTEGSGSAVMACKAGILTAGRAESFSSQPDHHLKRTRYTHQVFLLTLTILKNEAYTIYQAQEYGMPLVLLFRNYRYLQIFEDISNSFTDICNSITDICKRIADIRN